MFSKLRDANTGNQTFIQFAQTISYMSEEIDVFRKYRWWYRDLHGWGNLTVRFDTTSQLPLLIFIEWSSARSF